MVPDKLCRDYDATALSLGHTPKLDDRGRVVPIGPPDDPSIPDDRAPYYVVWNGRGVGLFRNWGLTNAMVSGYSGASFKLYTGLWNARSGWAAGPLRSGAPGWIPPKPRPAVTTPRLPPLSPAPVEPEDSDEFQMPSNFDAMPPAPIITLEVSPEDYIENPNTQNDDPQLPPAPFPPAPNSPHPSISAITDASELSSPSWMSTGTISVRSLDVALELSSSMTNLSMGERYIAVDNVVMDYIASITNSSTRHSPSVRSASSLGLRGHEPAPGVNPMGPRQIPLNCDALTRRKLSGRIKGDPVYVVVRGERPGVYLDSDTALRAGGRLPGIKIIRFHSLKYACFQFVVEYMSGEVGIPRVVRARRR